jgi:antitoxin ParD1/3/4
MRSTQQLSITLPKDMADEVKAKVAAGEYATESEVIRDGLRTLLAYDEAKADQSNVVSSADVRARLDSLHARSSTGRS